MMGEKMTPKFSILVVTLNAALEIERTIKSVQSQTYSNYEVIVKDGKSKDNTLLFIPKDERYRVYVKEDKSVYDGMNQALDMAKGEYIIFLNAGDMFYEPDTLKKVEEYIEKNNIKGKCVLYGDYSRNGEFIQLQKKNLDDFYLYRSPLCHQSIFYSRDIFENQVRYDTKYKISADHDLTLKIWKNNIPFYHLGTIVCTYKGAGISETRTGLNTAKREKAEIVKKYYSGTHRIVYNFIIACSLSSVRAWMVSNKSPEFVRKGYRKIRNSFMK